jgi:chromosome segregation ATPase
MSLEAALRRERSTSEGKSIALESIERELEIARQELTDKQLLVTTLQSEVDSLRNALDHDLGQRDEALTAHVQQMSLLATELSAKRHVLETVSDEKDALHDELKAREIDLSRVREQLTLKSKLIEELNSQLAEEKRQTVSCQIRVQELETCIEKSVGDLERKCEEYASLQRISTVFKGTTRREKPL